MKKTIPYRMLHWLMLLLFLSGMAGTPAQGKTIDKPVEEVGKCRDDDGYINYAWHGTVYKEPGTYTYQETLPNGDIVNYTLILYDHQIRTISVKITEGSRVTVLGKDYTKEGSYTDTIKSLMENGCDTVVRLDIQYAEYFHEYDTIHMCEGDSWPTWRGKKRNKPGTHIDRYTTPDGRDSIYQLQLIVHYNTEHWETIYVCSPQKVYYLNGMPIWENGDYDSDVKNPYGCDSLIHAHIEFVQTPKPIVDTVRFCGNLTIIRQDTSLFINKEMTVYDTLHTSCGCDSLIGTHYSPYPTHLIEEIRQVYTDKPISVDWRDSTYTEIGVYYDSLVNQYGCDSVYQLRVIPKSDEYEVFTICKGQSESVIIGDLQKPDTIVIQRDTIIIDSLKNSYGGDSLIHKTFNVEEPFYLSQRITLCSNQYVVWRGHYNINENGDTIPIVIPPIPGPFRDAHQSVGGCDSIYTIEVTVLPAHTKDTVLARCNDSLTTHNTIKWIDSKGVPHEWAKPNTDTIFRDTIARTAAEYIEFEDGSTALQPLTGGCDSIINWRIVTGDFCSPREMIPVCIDDSVEVDDKWYKEPGRYYNTIPIQIMFKDGESFVFDSIHNFEIYQAYPHTEEVDTTVRELKLHFMFHDTKVDREGDYTVHTITKEGCDSIINLHVHVIPTVLPPPIHHQYCQNEHFEITLANGQVITDIGTTYYDTIYGIESDTIQSIIVDWNETFYETHTAYFLHGSSYPWKKCGRDTLLKDPGVYLDSCKNIYGCDSVHRLELKEAEPFSAVDPASPYTFCAHEMPFEWHGQLITESGTYYDKNPTIFGLDSIWETEVIVNRDTLIQRHVSLCQDSTYDFFGHILSEPGVYRSQPFPRFKTGCDSIIELILQPASTLVTDMRYKFCEEDLPVDIGGFTITTAGTYIDTLTSSLSCDSVVRYIVSVGKKYFFSAEALINPGTTYTWTGHRHDTVLSTPGTYWDSCQTAFGCDSIYKLTLTLNEETYFFTEKDSVCSADLPYVWHHQSLTETGVYYDKKKTDKGLDSIYCLYLTVIPSTYERVELDFCEGERRVINGIPHEHDTTFTDTLQTHLGCDSIVKYVLHFHPTYNISLVVNLIEGESYQLGDTILKTSGVYFKRFHTEFGCDSLVTVRIKICSAPKEEVKYHELCEGQKLSIGGQIITSSGTYYEHRTAMDGCDSLITHIVNVHSSYLYTTSIAICKGGSYQWMGHFNDTVLDKPGVYDDIHTTIHGCDSIYRLVLNYKRTDVRDSVISICESSLPYLYNGEPYFKDSIFADTLGLNGEGCDSIIRWNYRINYHCSDFAQYYICPGAVTSIDGLVISEAGTYEKHHLTTGGQDSIFRFIVHLANNYEFNTQVSGCDSVVYDNQTFYARGTGRETFVVDIHHSTIDGCDSLEHLELTIHQSSPAHVINKTIADYDSVRFGPYWYNTTGSYSLRHQNIYECDSMEILNLTVLKTEYPDILHFFMCEGDPKGVEIFGRLFHPTEEYTYISDTTWIASQPVIRTADIVLQHPFTIEQFYPDENQIVCSDHEVLFYVNFATRDVSIMPDYYEVDFMVGDLEAHPLHQEGNVNGKTTLPIMMGGQGKYVSPGYYRYRLKLRSESCVVSDTILEGSIVVRYPDNVMEAAWNDVVMLVNEQHNGGGWAFRPPYKWTVLSEQGVDKTALVAGDAKQPYLYSEALEEGDRISALLYREGYGRPIPSCEFVFIPNLSVSTYPILIYPTAVQENMPVAISASKKGAFRLFNEMGRACTSGTFDEGETLVTMPSRSGCYLMMVQDHDGNRMVQKIIVY